MLNLSVWDHCRHLDQICSCLNSTRNDRRAGTHSGVRGGMSRRDTVRSDGGIQSVLAVLLPSAQTFINITSQPSEKPTSNMEGLLAPARNCRVGLGVVMWLCVHVNVHLHLVVQDLHKLLHGGQVT